MLGFDAFNENELVAHYVCIPMETSILGIKEKTLLSLNTATHPNWQGNKLFTQLALKTYEVGAKMGFFSVFAVANQNSTHGFLKRLNFELISPLDLEIGFGKLNLSTKEPDLKIFWSENQLDWRLNNPLYKLKTRKDKDKTQIFSNALKNVIYPYTEIKTHPYFIERRTISRLSLLKPRLFVGLTPSTSKSQRAYIKLPKFLRPVPLNLIYKRLDKKKVLINPGQVFFSFIDFDIL